MMMENRNKLLCSPFLFIIWIYQSFVSPFLTPSCRFWPSCSEYSKQAFLKHGPVGGLWLSFKRLLRCHPFHPGGVDEAPDKIGETSDKIT